METRTWEEILATNAKLAGWILDVQDEPTWGGEIKEAVLRDGNVVLTFNWAATFKPLNAASMEKPWERDATREVEFAFPADEVGAVVLRNGYIKFVAPNSCMAGLGPPGVTRFDASNVRGLPAPKEIVRRFVQDGVALACDVHAEAVRSFAAAFAAGTEPSDEVMLGVDAALHCATCNFVVAAVLGEPELLHDPGTRLPYWGD